MKTIFTILRGVLLSSVCIWTLAPPAWSEDIDLFTALPPLSEEDSVEAPTVLLVWDTAARGSATADAKSCKYGGVESVEDNDVLTMQKCAIHNAIHAIGEDPDLLNKIRVGLMMYNQSGSCGQLMIEPMLLTADNVKSFTNRMRGDEFAAAKVRANNSRDGDTLSEAWAMLNAREKSCSGTNYAEFATTATQCRDAYVIFIGNAFTNSNPNDGQGGTLGKLQAQLENHELLGNYGYSRDSKEFEFFTEEISVTGFNKSNSNNADSWARFMKQVNTSDTELQDRNVTTYTVSVFAGSTLDDGGSSGPGKGKGGGGQGSGQSRDQGTINYYSSVAKEGGGKGFEVSLDDISELTDALLNVFLEVQAVNSVFASASLPISANTQGTFLNQVYIAMFRPAEQSKHRWLGNLKQYHLGFDAGNNLVLTDSRFDPDTEVVEDVTNPATGNLSPNTISFWTAGNPEVAKCKTVGVDLWPADGFWRKAIPDAPYDCPDGDLVEKGGAGQSIRADNLTSQASRKLLTCGSSSKCPAANSTFAEFVDSADFRTSSGLSAETINWLRGADNSGNENPVGPCDGESDCPITIRPSVHGDVIHSRPAVVNYGNSVRYKDDVIVFYGANDGVFRAINGNKTKTITTSDGRKVRPGGELWGFVAPEFFPKLERLRSNDPLLFFPGSPEDLGAKRKDYFFDGSPSMLQDERTKASHSTAKKTFVYLTARRGGRILYALDVTDPAVPKFMWKLDETHINELGQTWSQPRVALIKGYDEEVKDENGDTVKGEDGNPVMVAKPVLVMGAGYDPAEDADPSPGATDATYKNTQGRGMVILDAVTGEVVWSALASCSGSALTQIVGDSGNCLKVDALTRSVAADVTVRDRDGDGLVDRLYLADVGASVWRVDLGVTPVESRVSRLAALGGVGNNARKFLFPPDVIPVSKNMDLVAIASGDREHPLYTDQQTVGLAYNVENRFYLLKDDGSSELDVSKLIDIAACSEANGDVCNISQLDSGYYFAFGKGEKGVNAPLVVAGKVFFATNQPDVPDTDSCSANLGIARAYEVSFKDGSFKTRLFVGGGMPPSPIAGQVTIGGKTVPFMIGGKGESPFKPHTPEIDPPGGLDRTYWYFE